MWVRSQPWELSREKQTRPRGVPDLVGRSNALQAAPLDCLHHAIDQIVVTRGPARALLAALGPVSH